MLGHHLAEQATLPFTQADLPQARLHLGDQAEPSGERRRRLRRAAQGGNVDRVDAGTQPGGYQFGLRAPVGREGGIGLPVHQRGGGVQQGGFRFAVPDKEQLGRVRRYLEAVLPVAGRRLRQIFRLTHDPGSVAAVPAGGPIRPA